MTFVKIFWIVLLVISISSIIKIFKEKGWTIKNFIRIEDVDDENGCIHYVRRSHKQKEYRPHGR